MKNLLLSLGVCVGLSAYAQAMPDSVAMIVNGKPVPLTEFVFIAKKNAEVNLTDKRSVKNYVELFKNFKLKVADAESAGMEQTESFKKELDGYHRQLVNGYLSDKEAERQAAQAEYDRGAHTVEFSHILFRLPEETVSKDTAAVYAEAMQAYARLCKGESIETVGKELADRDDRQVAYEYVRCLRPMQTLKAFEDAAYSLPIGEISKPVRTRLGFHLIQVHSRKPNPGRLRVAHILFAFPKEATAQDTVAVKTKAESIYKELVNGADFGEMATRYSADPGSAKKKGELPWFGVGEMVAPFESAAFQLTTPGQISDLVETSFGYHIIQLLERKERASFQEEERALRRKMGQGEHNFDLYRAFDERMKLEYGYRFFPEAYAALQALCDDYFPTSRAFYEKAKELKEPLFHVDGRDFTQADFAYYIQRSPFSTKTYSGDFMREVFDLYVRDIVTEAERSNLEQKHPEMPLLMQEYRDGILLFEISNQKVWSHPAAEQKALEKAWIEELNRKYPVEVNWKVLKKLN